jgi:hypothetical protein
LGEKRADFHQPFLVLCPNCALLSAVMVSFGQSYSVMVGTGLVSSRCLLRHGNPVTLCHFEEPGDEESLRSFAALRMTDGGDERSGKPVSIDINELIIKIPLNPPLMKGGIQTR